MPRSKSRPRDGVFLNVPFDRQYRRLFEALIFAVHDCGLIARCALESDDGTQIRLEKICQIIDECRLGIHDLSRTSLDRLNRLPRFNMPLELGLFLGAKRFGRASNARKSALILERRPYRYQIYCSDLAGQDIHAHRDDTLRAVVAVRNWLQIAASARVMSVRAIAIRYLTFRDQLPDACIPSGRDFLDLSFLDFRTEVDNWRAGNP
jgi:hypothetical protein